MKRRELFKNISGVFAVATVAPFLLTAVGGSVAKAEDSRRKKANAGPMIDVNDPTAKGVGYVEDFKKAPKSAGNKCSTCTLYVKKESVNGQEAGSCAIFPNKLVYGNAYCNSWVKKA